MILFKNLKGRQVRMEAIDELEIDCQGLTLLPALIDPHVHFRTPGAEHKENWESGARAALAGGVTCVCDMPNTDPPTLSEQSLSDKGRLIDAQLKRAGIPLRYALYLGATEAVARSCRGAFALKIFMGPSTGNLQISSDEGLSRAFAIAAEANLSVAVHAEEPRLIGEPATADPAEHSRVRSSSAAAAAIARALALAEQMKVRLLILHVSSAAELELIRAAKKRGLPVYAESTPHHLFLNTESYALLGTRALVNPPLREKSDQEALWEAVRDGTIDWIGSDHAPHLLAEKELPFGASPSGFPGIETLLPLLLTSVAEGRLTLEDVVRLTHTNPKTLFGLDVGNDCVLVDLKREKAVQPRLMQSRAGWSPYASRALVGWPVYTLLRGRLYHVADGVVARVTKSTPSWNPEHSRVYHYERSYSENASKGPYFKGVVPVRELPPEGEWIDFLGHRVASRVGVPAGPLLNSRWVSLAAKLGFDIVTYKTIRSHPFPGHPLPNVLLLDATAPLQPLSSIRVMEGPLISHQQLSITNSFGNPTQERSYLTEDIPRSASCLGRHQALVVSVVGVPHQEGGMEADFCRASSLASSFGASIIEANFSCPNVASCESELYQDPEAIRRIAALIVKTIAPRPLIMKMGLLRDQGHLQEVLTAASEAGVRAVAGINTVKMEILTHSGAFALGTERRFGGVCGAATRELALGFIASCRNLIDQHNLGLTLIGMGGVTESAHFDLFLAAGADFVQTATGMMWDPYLAMRYHKGEE